jgi:hypothetical protein
MVAAQWAKGTSLYGDYWVDRLPGLIMLFQLAHVAGGPIGLRLLGAACVGSSVLLAAGLASAALRADGRFARGSRVVVIGAAATAAAFLVSPLFGATEVDGEILAVPFVLAGLTATLTAYRSTLAATRWWIAAGALAVAAAAVKQTCSRSSWLLACFSSRQRAEVPAPPPGPRWHSEPAPPSAHWRCSAGLRSTARARQASGTQSSRSASRPPP